MSAVSYGNRGPVLALWASVVAQRLGMRRVSQDNIAMARAEARAFSCANTGSQPAPAAAVGHESEPFEIGPTPTATLGRFRVSKRNPPARPTDGDTESAAAV